jgi:Flp pilus assembly protein TadB
MNAAACTAWRLFTGPSCGATLQRADRSAADAGAGDITRGMAAGRGGERGRKAAPQRAASERTRGEESATASDTYYRYSASAWPPVVWPSLDRWMDRRPPRARARKNRQGTRANGAYHVHASRSRHLSASTVQGFGLRWALSTHLSLPDWPPPLAGCGLAICSTVQTHVAATVLVLAVAASCRTPELRVRMRYVRRRRHLAAELYVPTS